MALLDILTWAILVFLAWKYLQLRRGLVDSRRARALVAEGATLLDVRSHGEYAADHLEGSCHIPVNELGARQSELPDDRPVVVYCHSGMRAALAARTLRNAGREVHNVGTMGRYRS